MHRFAFAALFIAQLFTCDGVGPESESEQLVIRSGTSFGECLGYCRTELSVDGDRVRFTRSSWNGDPPDQLRSLDISEAEWDALVAAIDWEAFAGLEEVYGCPDCADGGAEWVELSTPEAQKRVTFDHGAELPEIATLLERIRGLRSAFADVP